MEWALQAHDLRLLQEPWQGLPPEASAIRETVTAFPGFSGFGRLYFGSEVCEKALPSPDLLRAAVEAASAAAMDFSLITPYVTEPGLERTLLLLEELKILRPNCEVIVNDWGTLHLLFCQYPHFTPVLGRLMNKLVRDPRMPLSSPITADFRRCGLAAPPMQSLLRRYGVRRIEVDLLPQGFDEQMGHWGYALSMYIPFGCIATGRICLFESLGKQKDEKFQASPSPCPRHCQNYWMELYDISHQVPISERWVLIQKGNSVFYRQEAPLIREGLEQALATGIDRIVFQPEPM
ncbi:hypothetical protein GTO91_04200 [Heliobacterium undosum]|uniref:U32 family peptidase n=1 Tax=Heliomicrobium undosum TaxID=121734 RepID=A0A845L2Y4_9FIRM|nr:hypothetical protein [Heliomicrobium undosum]MZP28910.1 hypothetical protein [Heliomicrobium undosum]